VCVCEKTGSAGDLKTLHLRTCLTTFFAIVVICTR
jgi:hypothetical protein